MKPACVDLTRFLKWYEQGGKMHTQKIQASFLCWPRFDLIQHRSTENVKGLGYVFERRLHRKYAHKLL